MEKSLFKYVMRHSKRDQIVIVLASFLSFPLILAALYIPKLIVNEVLGEGEFPREYLTLNFERLPFLFTLCGALLGLIILNNGLKYFINVRKGLTGERMLRRMRFEFFSRIVKQPTATTKTKRPVEMVQAIVAEMEPIGAFIGEIVATPIYQGGHLIVYLGFILMQDPFLGLAAIILFPVQAYVIPIVQRRVVAYVQQRIIEVRRLSSELNDSLQSVDEMLLNGTMTFHQAQISSRLYRIFTIRYRIYILKFAVKFANNVINHLIPFFFYAFGGYLVLQGRMDLGALVAILAAYKDIASPWKELLRYYQTYSDITARYTTSVDSFASGPEARQGEPREIDGQVLGLNGISTSASVENGGLSNVFLRLEPGTLTLLTGSDDAAREGLVRLIAGLEIPATGNFQLGDATLRAHDMLSLSRDVGFAGKNPMLLSDTLHQNLTYGILGQVARGTRPKDWPAREREGRLTGTPPDDPAMDWTDYSRAGVADEDALMVEIVNVLRLVGAEDAVFALGLEHRRDTSTSEETELRESLLDLRAELTGLEELPGASLVEPFDRDAFMENATLFENLFFGCWDVPMSGRQAITKRRDLRQAITKLGIEDDLAHWGLEAATILAKLLASVAESPSILKRIDLVSPEDLERLESIASIGSARGLAKLNSKDRWFLIGLALDLRPIRHRLGVLDPAERRAAIIAHRMKIARDFKGFTAFDSTDYIPGLTAIENILMARPRLDRREARVSIEDVLHDYIGDGPARVAIVAAGLQEHVTSGGNELSAAQKRMLGLARALLRRPKLLLIEALPHTRAERAEELLQKIRADRPDVTIVASLPNIEGLSGFDHAYQVEGGMLHALAPLQDHKKKELSS